MQEMEISHVFLSEVQGCVYIVISVSEPARYSADRKITASFVFLEGTLSLEAPSVGLFTSLELKQAGCADYILFRAKITSVLIMGVSKFASIFAFVFGFRFAF